MTKRVVLILLVVPVLCSTGCLFSRKSRQQKESAAIATETEKEFRQRWMARRIAELGAQGVTGPAAQQQAEQEFAAKFAFTHAVKK